MQRKIKVLYLLVISLLIIWGITAYQNNTQNKNKNCVFEDASISAGIFKLTPTFGNPIWLDLDKDGNLDIFIVNHSTFPSLFYNKGNETFTDIISSSGIKKGLDRHGAAWGDYDGDGDLDLFITVGAAYGTTVGDKKDELYRNEGNGKFLDVSEDAGVLNAYGRGRSVNWIDINNDGYLDLYINNSKSPNVVYKNNGDGTFVDVSLESGLNEDDGGSISSWADYDSDGDIDLFVAGRPARLWQNDGKGRFSDVTKDTPLAGYYAEGASWGDYDNDGDLDLYIARGYRDTNNFFQNDGKTISFSDIESLDEDGLDFVTSGENVYFDIFLNKKHRQNKITFGAANKKPASVPFTLNKLEAWGVPSYIAGEDEGYYIWADEDSWHIRWIWEKKEKKQKGYFYGRITTDGMFSSVVPKNLVDSKDIPSDSLRDTLYENKGGGFFSDVTRKAALGSSENSRTGIWGDFNNDGYLDLYVVNAGTFSQNASNILYQNNKDGTFKDVTIERSADGFCGGRGRGCGAAWGDFNNDGFLDLFITNGFGLPISDPLNEYKRLINGPYTLYKNTGNKDKWIKITLRGTESNKDAIGTKIVLEAGRLTQFREAISGNYQYSQPHAPIHFGLGEASIIDKIVIKWPSGRRQVFTGIKANQHIIVTEDSSNLESFK